MSPWNSHPSVLGMSLSTAYAAHDIPLSKMRLPIFVRLFIQIAGVSPVITYDLSWMSRTLKSHIFITWQILVRTRLHIKRHVPINTILRFTIFGHQIAYHDLLLIKIGICVILVCLCWHLRFSHLTRRVDISSNTMSYFVLWIIPSETWNHRPYIKSLFWWFLIELIHAFNFFEVHFFSIYNIILVDAFLINHDTIWWILNISVSIAYRYTCRSLSTDRHFILILPVIKMLLFLFGLFLCIVMIRYKDHRFYRSEGGADLNLVTSTAASMLWLLSRTLSLLIFLL
jgi:hypothetical protein